MDLIRPLFLCYLLPLSGIQFAFAQSPIDNFQSQLSTISQNNVTALDSATFLFQAFATSNERRTINDSLFFPHYWNFYYDFGAKYLAKAYQSDSLSIRPFINQFGYQLNSNHKIYPADLPYLKEHILPWLSLPMQDFQNQHLREFTEANTVLSYLNNSLWWEQFQSDHPEFRLKEMVQYHYAKWHLMHLVKGTKIHPLFDDNQKLNESFQSAWQLLLTGYPESRTAKIISPIYQLLEKNDFQKTATIEALLNQL